jgi:hypothetical protein
MVHGTPGAHTRIIRDHFHAEQQHARGKTRSTRWTRASVGCASTSLHTWMCHTNPMVQRHSPQPPGDNTSCRGHPRNSCTSFRKAIFSPREGKSKSLKQQQWQLTSSVGARQLRPPDMLNWFASYGETICRGTAGAAAEGKVSKWLTHSETHHMEQSNFVECVE